MGISRDRRGHPRSAHALRAIRRRVFVVDDDPAALGVLAELAADLGWDAYGFTRLAAARRALRQLRPQMMIVDDDLPDGRGGDFVRELRKGNGMADVSIIVCTAAQPLRRAEIGAWAPVLPKPIDLSEVECLMRAAGRRANGSRLNRAG
jgi:DNA-binding response OmpR family regulator